jgi:hypothetical protein
MKMDRTRQWASSLEKSQKKRTSLHSLFVTGYQKSSIIALGSHIFWIWSHIELSVTLQALLQYKINQSAAYGTENEKKRLLNIQHTCYVKCSSCLVFDFGHPVRKPLLSPRCQSSSFVIDSR